MVPYHTFQAHRGRVTAITYAEEGDVLVSAGTDGMVRFWDAANGRSRGEWRVESGVTCMALSPSGTRLVVGARRGGCSVWSYPEGAQLATMARHNRPVATVDVAPSGRIVASASYNGTVRLWGIDDCEEIDSIVNERRRTAGAVFSPGGQYLVTNGFGGAIGVWTVPGLELLRAAHCHETAVYPPVFSPDGLTMATHGVDFQVRFWSTDEWTFAGSITLSDRSDLRIAFGADPARLFAVTERSVREIDPGAGTVAAHRRLRTARATSLAVSPDGETLSVGTRSGEVVLLAYARHGVIRNE
jgi:WD40 repeat protein